jgi:DNA mismatch repair protein MutH
MAPVAPPESEAELLRRAESLAGQRLADLAHALGTQVPADLRRAKGWPGQLVEAWLGASAGSLAEPDFRNLGVELKTIPVGRDGDPLESTYVCTVPLEGACAATWENSWVRRKLARVLWLPMEADRETPLAQRRVGAALLWSLEPDLEAVLRTDWEEIMELVCLGRLAELSARLGVYLQVRPKAANARSLRRSVGADGGSVLTNPRGFYLRAAFTREVLRRHYALPP